MYLKKSMLVSEGRDSVAVTAANSLQVPSLVDALYSAIRERILTGELPGGAPLTEMDLATHYSVARPTAKAAMERLVYDGLLRRASNKTARVPVLDSDDIRDLYYSRAFLEREVMIELATKRLVPEPARRSLQALRDVGPDPVVTEVVEVDIAFHRAMVEAVGSPRLNRLYSSLMGEVHLCMAQVQAHHLLSPIRIADEHSEIVAAIEAGDVARAAAEVTGHLDRACVRLIGHVDADQKSDQ
jgi:DNA-binding GntR family transcriptional regulator